jgi:uncharacterized delta-60 repeat protein
MPALVDTLDAGLYERQMVHLNDWPRRVVRLALLICVLLSRADDRTEASQPGTLDRSFHPGPTMNGEVWTLGVQTDGRVLVAGNFTEIQGVPRRWLARLNADNTVDESFAPDPELAGRDDGLISKILLLPNDQTLMVGDFAWGAGAHQGVVRLNSTGRIDPSFDPGTGTTAAWTLLRRPDGTILVGGGFDEFNGTRRHKVVQLLANGQLDPSFDTGAGPDDIVTALLLQPDGKLVVGGLFKNWNGAARPGLVRLNPDGTLDSSFRIGAGVNGVVLSLAQDTAGRILVAGSFVEVDGAAYRCVARLNADGSVDSSFSNRLNLREAVWKVLALEDGGYLLGGDFKKIEGANRIRIARLLANGRLDYSFIHETGAPDDTVLEIVPAGNGRLYVGGEFRHFGGMRTPPVVRLESEGKLDSQFPATIGSDLPATTVGVSPAGRIWLGGDFSYIHGLPRRGLACLFPDGRVDPRVDLPVDLLSGVRAFLFGEDETVIVAGNFTTIGGVNQRGIARVRADGTLDQSFRPLVDGSILAVARQADGRIAIVGGFQSVEGFPRPGVALLAPDGTLVPEFAPTLVPNDTVGALGLSSSGAVTIGGGFEFVGHLHPPYLARLDSSGGAEPAFRENLGPDRDVYSISTLDSGHLIVAGAFGFYNGKPCGRVIRLHANGALDESFPLDLSADIPVSAGVEPNGNILVWGGFNRFAGADRASLLRLTPNGRIDPGFASVFPVNNAVYTVGRQRDGKLVVAGSFLECDGVERVHLTRLFGENAIASEIAFQPGTASYDGSRGFRARFAAPPGQVVISEVSQDLRSWAPLATNTMPATGVMEMADPLARLSSPRFYRAVAR